MKFASSALAAAAAAAFAVTPALANEAPAAGAAKVKCEGINSCKGQAACKTADHACKGQNKCKGHGWVESTEKECKEKKGKVMKDK